MRKVRSAEIRAVAADMLTELAKMQPLAAQIQRVQSELDAYPERADLLYENFALKLHNFYTGCERIFQIVATELNGGVPSGRDWHRRLLDRMKAAREDRPAVISTAMAVKLQNYLGFRHVVRSLYGYELDPKRIAELVRHYPDAWSQFEREIQAFVIWLRELAASLDG